MIKPGYITAEMSKHFEEAIRLGVEGGVHTVGIRSDIFGWSVVDITDDDVGRMKEFANSIHY
jgi:hypothetical protein